MIHFELNKVNYNKLKENIYGLRIESVLDILLYKEEIQNLINYFNQEYVWDDMFDFEKVKERISKDQSMYILYFKNQPIGYVFMEPIKEEKKVYLYNLYVTNVVERPDLSPVWFVNNTMKMEFERDWCEKITCYCDDWNVSAQTVFIRNGFEKVFI